MEIHNCLKPSNGNFKNLMQNGANPLGPRFGQGTLPFGPISGCNQPSNYVPDKNTPIKTVRITFNVIQYSHSDPRNFTQNDIPFLRNSVVVANWIYANLVQPTSPSCPILADTDAKIQFDLSNRIHFIVDPFGWHNLNYANQLNSSHYLYLNHAYDAYSSINIFFVGNQCIYDEIINNLTCPEVHAPNHDIRYNIGYGTVGSGGQLCFSTFSGDYKYFNPGPGIIMNNFYLKYHQNPNLDFGMTLAHELGHCFGLPDLYNGTCNGLMVSSGGTTSGNHNYLDPTELGTIHMSLANGFQRAYLTLTVYDPQQNVTVTATEVWKVSKVIGGDLIIKKGGKLTIQCKVSFPELGSLFVEAGGMLIIDGGILTSNSCHEWKGVEVWGDSNKSQTYSNQGVIILMNGALIENAEIGVLLSNRADGYYTNGGVIKADRSTFQNNRIGVSFWNYSSPKSKTGSTVPNVSSITNCNFLCERPMMNSSFIDQAGRRLGTSEYIKMWGVDGVKIINNKFETDISTYSGYNFIDDLRGTGINCIDSTTPHIIDNHFNNLTFGIYSLGNNSKTVLIIRNNFFDNVLYGVTGDFNFSKIFNNQFNNIPRASNFTFNTCYGILLLNATGIDISDNSFTGVSLYNWPTFCYGVDIRNSGSFGGKIYNNKFLNLEIGTLLEGNNTSLQISCNTYTFTKNAWASLNLTNTTFSLPDQGTGCGTNEIRGGNIFNDIYNPYNGIPTNTHKHLNGGGIFTYYAWGDPVETVPLWLGGSVSGAIIKNCAASSHDPQSCLPRRATGPKSGNRLSKPLVKLEEKVELNEKISELLIAGKIKDAIILIEKTHYPENYIILAELYIEVGMANYARNMLAILEKNESNLNFTSICEILFEQKQNGIVKFALNEKQKYILQGVVNSNTVHSEYAAKYLSLSNGEYYYPPVFHFIDGDEEIDLSDIPQ